MRPIEILGSGIALPDTIVTSEEIDRKQGYEIGFTEKATGVVSRHYALNETASDLALVAIDSALDNAGLHLDAIDCIIGASGTMEQAIPYNAAKVHAKLSPSRPIPSFDVNMTCLSALMAMDVASAMIDRGQYKRILIFSSEIASAGANWNDIAVGGLFGDGASAMVLSKSTCASKGIRSVHFETHSEGVDYCQIRGGGSLNHPRKIKGDYRPYGMFEMQGKEVYKLTAKVIDQFVDALFKDITIPLNDIDWIVPHQASKLAIQHIQKKLNMNPEKVINIVEDRGNQVAASLPSALHELLSSNKAQPGDNILLLGTSAGLGLGGMVLAV